MVIELIHAAPDLTELRQITEFTRFDAEISADPDGQNDWMLEMPVECWQAEPVSAGHYVYVSDSEWGGPVERVRHSSTDGAVRLYGTCWRGLLTRRAICPPTGQTHTVYENADASDMLSDMLSGWLPQLIMADEEPSGIICSGKIRYRNMLRAAQQLLGAAGGNLRVRFSEGKMRIWAESVRSHVNDIELSQDYDCNIISQRSSARYDHIVALGQGEMLERTVVERWLLPDGTVTADSTELGVTEEPLRRTLIYEYTAAESEEQLAEAAENRLIEDAGGDVMEISLSSAEDALELGDAVAVRDMAADMLNTLTVEGMTLTADADSAEIKYRLA